MFKSLIVSKSHKRAPSDGFELKKNQPANALYTPAAPFQAPLPRPDHHLHSQMRAGTRTEHISTCPPAPEESQASLKT